MPTDVVLAIDLSGSMNNDQADPPEPISSVLTAAEAFVMRMQSGDQAGVVTFATNANTEQVLTNNIAEVADTVESLEIDPSEERGSTNTGEAINQALSELISARHNTAARKVLVLLTDGLTTAPGEDPDAYALAAASEAKAAGINIYTIGLGEQVNMEFVRQLASSRNQAYQAISRSQINDIYETITGDICEDGAAIIDIVPKTNASFAPLQ